MHISPIHHLGFASHRSVEFKIFSVIELRYEFEKFLNYIAWIQGYEQFLYSPTVNAPLRKDGDLADVSKFPRHWLTANLYKDLIANDTFMLFFRHHFYNTIWPCSSFCFIDAFCTYMPCVTFSISAASLLHPPTSHTCDDSMTSPSESHWSRVFFIIRGWIHWISGITHFYVPNEHSPHRNLRILNFRIYNLTSRRHIIAKFS